MAPIKMATSVWHNSLLPRDAVMINPVLNGTGPTTDAQQLVDEWIVAFKGWANLGATAQVTVKAYDVSKPKPNYPLYERTDNVGFAPAVSSPREIACCLSFYATNNVKRRRGRLYIPYFWIGAAGGLGDRPSQTIRDKVGSLAQILQDIGGVDIDWSVWSKADGAARAVTNWWVDDEWDVQRRRGLRGSTRTEGTTSEETTRTTSLV